jgi:hypothetical protein
MRREAGAGMVLGAGGTAFQWAGRAVWMSDRHPRITRSWVGSACKVARMDGVGRRCDVRVTR